MRGLIEAGVIPLLALCISVSSSRSVADDRPSSVLFCDLLSIPQKYDKKVVATEALIQSSDHEVHVDDSKCRSTMTENRSASIELGDGWNSTKLGKKLSKIRRHHRPAQVAFEAIFQASGGPFGPEATRFHFVLRRLVSVEKASK